MRPNDELLQKIGIVRSKWKMFLWFRGLSWVLGVLVASLLIGLAVANTPSTPTWAVTGLRLAFIAAFIFTVFRALVMPLRRVPDDTQLARFVEEKNPGLEDRLVSAVEVIRKPKPGQKMFSQLLVKDAIARTKHLRFSDQVNKRHSGTFAALTAAFAVALLISVISFVHLLPAG